MPDTKSITVTLTTPVYLGTEKVMELTFRPMRGADLVAAGLPFSTDGRTEINAPAMAQMMSRLANQPPSLIGQLTPYDWMNCVPVIMGFFRAPVPAPSSTDTSRSESTGATSGS